MIIDSLQNAAKYVGLHPQLGTAFQYIKDTDLLSQEMGSYLVDGDVVRAIFSEAPGKTAATALEKFECHNQNIDIQVLIQGSETMGWKPRQSCSLQNGDYNSEKDVQFYLDEPDTYFMLQPGQFVIFFPEDVHAPMIGEGNIKKLVMKIKI